MLAQELQRSRLGFSIREVDDQLAFTRVGVVEIGDREDRAFRSDAIDQADSNRVVLAGFQPHRLGRFDGAAVQRSLLRTDGDRQDGEYRVEKNGHSRHS